MTTILLATFTLREAIRKKAVLGGAILTVVFLLLYTTGTYLAFGELNRQQSIPPATRQSINGELLLAGLYFVNFIAGLLAIFTAVGTISGEVEHGTLHAIVPKPLHRWEVVLGKWLGFAAMLAIYVVVTAAVCMLVVRVQSGYVPRDALGGIGVMLLQALLLLSLTVLGTSTQSTVTNGIIVFMVYALALAGGRLEQLGTLIRNQTLIDIGIMTSLVIPTDALWRLASSMVGSGGFLGNGSTAQPGMFTVTDAPSGLMVVYAGVYSAAALVAAVIAFQRRDL